MRIRCLHGYFIFEEQFPADISDFISLTGLELVSRGPYYTFKGLAEAPGYSIEGQPLLDATAIKTFSGEPWEVFEANQVVFDFSRGVVAPIQSVTLTAEIKSVGNSYWSNGLLLPGSLTPQGRVKDFDANFSFSRRRWLYTEVAYV